MSTHNICFHGEISKIIPYLSPNIYLICSTDLRPLQYLSELPDSQHFLPSTFLSWPELLSQSRWTEINNKAGKFAINIWALFFMYDVYWFATYRKFPKYSDTQKICCNHSKIWIMWLYHTVVSPNDADGMANSVDPDPLGADQDLHCLPRNVCPKT